MRNDLTAFVALAALAGLVAVSACSSSSSSGSTNDGGTSSGSGSGGGSGAGGASSGSSGGSGGSGGGSGGSGGGSGGSSSGSGGSGSGGRAVATCAQAEQVAQVTGGKLVSGSWGTIPTALRQLPSGATLCGTAYSGATDAASNAGFTYLLSDLSGAGISTFYGPVVGQMSGCTPLTEVAGSFSFTCPCSNPPCGMNKAQGIIAAAPSLQILELGYSN